MAVSVVGVSDTLISPFLFYFNSSVSICFLVYLLFCWFDGALLSCFFPFFKTMTHVKEKISWTNWTRGNWHVLRDSLQSTCPWILRQSTCSEPMEMRLSFASRSNQAIWALTENNTVWRSNVFILILFLVPHPSQAFADSSHRIVLFLRLYCQCTQSTLNLSSCGILLWPRPRRHAPATLQAQCILEKGI